MKKKTLQKITAAVMALTFIGGSIHSGSTSLFVSPCIVKADIITADNNVNVDYDPAIYDNETGVLTLRGNVSKGDVKKYTQAKKVVCEEGTVFPSDCSFMFDMFSAESFDLSNADTSNVYSMERMFYCCRYAESLDLSSWNTSNVRRMDYMFSETNFVSLNLSNWDTSKVADMSYMFWCARKLKSLDLKHFDTSDVRTMEYMFCDCYDLESLDISNFNTANVTSMKEMFMNCRSLTALDVSSFNTSNVENMYWMFGECDKLASIDVTNFDTSKADPDDNLYSRTSTYAMFMGCPALEENIVHYDGTSVTLGDSISVVFHIHEKKDLNSKSSANLAKIVMSGPNGDISITNFSRKNDENPDGIDISYGRMKCVYPLDATQANEKVTLKAYDENGKQLILCKLYAGSYAYSLCNHCQLEASLNDYLTTIKNNYSYYKTDTKLQNLVSSIENYCSAADNYFNGTENIVDGYSDENGVYVENLAPEFGSDIKMSLVLNSKTAIRIYTDKTGVLIDGKEATPRTTNYGKCYEISNIAAHQLMERHTLTINGKDYQFTPMSYVYRVIYSETASQKLTDVAWATYLYARAAITYKNQK